MTITVQDKADILRKNWDKAQHFADGELNTLGWNNPFPHGGKASDYVQILEGIWQDLSSNGWSSEECKILMLGGERASALLRNS